MEHGPYWGFHHETFEFARARLRKGTQQRRRRRRLARKLSGRRLASGQQQLVQAASSTCCAFFIVGRVDSNAGRPAWRQSFVLPWREQQPQCQPRDRRWTLGGEKMDRRGVEMGVEVGVGVEVEVM